MEMSPDESNAMSNDAATTARILAASCQLPQSAAESGPSATSISGFGLRVIVSVSR